VGKLKPKVAKDKEEKMIIDLLNISGVLKDFFLARLFVSKKSFCIGLIGHSRGRHEIIWWAFSFFVGHDPEHHFRFAVKIQLFGHRWKWTKKKK